MIQIKYGLIDNNIDITDIKNQIDTIIIWINPSNNDLILMEEY
jgi:hypothetical protein